jgi:HK97 family phage prohead protease
MSARLTTPPRLVAEGFLVRDAGPGAVPEARTQDYVCSTPTIDSHGTALEPVWQLDRYVKNPVVLFVHNNKSIPVGSASNVRVEGGQLLATVTFATEDVNEEAEDVWRAVKAGLLRGISVGFIPHSYRWEMLNDEEIMVLSDLELLELSICPVPSNPDALAIRSINATGIDQIRAKANPAPSAQKRTTMNEEEMKALRASLSAKDSELATVRQAQVAAAAELAQERAVKLAADKLVAERDATIATLSTEATRLGGELTKLAERAVKAEDALTTSEIQARMGKDIEPHEVEHFVALKRSAPAIYDAEMKRRAGTGRDDKLAEQVIPADAAGQRASGESENINAALARHMPSALGPGLKEQDHGRESNRRYEPGARQVWHSQVCQRRYRILPDQAGRYGHPQLRRGQCLRRLCDGDGRRGRNRPVRDPRRRCPRARQGRHGRRHCRRVAEDGHRRRHRCRHPRRRNDPHQHRWQGRR